MENIKSHLEDIKVYLDEVDSENKLIYENFNELSENVDINIDNFDNAVSSVCFDYLKEINNVQHGELVNNKRTLHLKCHYDIFVKFQSGLKDVMNRYSDIFISNDDLVPTICYNDNIRSNKLNLSMINKYCGSYYYNEYYSDRRTYNGDIYIDHDSKNEDLLIKYMNNENELIDDINNMDFDERFKFLQDLDFFNLPVKIEYLNILGFNKDNRIMESWRKRKMVMTDDGYFENISKRLRKSGKMEEIYNDTLLNKIKYDDKNNCFGIDIKMKNPNIIENYLRDGRKWVEKTLILKDMKIDDIINEMNKFGMNLSDDEKTELEETWISVRYVFVNHSYNQTIDDYLKKEHKFISIYLNNMNSELYHDGLLCVNINMNNVDVIEKYLNNGREWRRKYLFVRGLKYNDILNDLNAIELKLNEKDKNKLQSEWLRLRRIWVNNDYKQSIDRYLKSNGKFIEIYENNISNETYDDFDDILYVNIKLKYYDIINDYIVHDQHLDIDLIKDSKSYKYNSFIKELQLLGIELSNKEMIKLKLAMYSFSRISNILDKKYDKYLKEWLENKYEWRCIYRASEHNYTAQSFHEYCDDVGPTLIVIKSHDGYIFGGYTTQSWRGEDEFKIDNNAFLFTLHNPYKVNPTRYNSLKDKGGIQCNSNEGPSFCNEENYALFICDDNQNCNEEECCFSANDGTRGYECNSKYKMSLFVNSAGPNNINDFSISDYEVFAIDFKNIDMIMDTTGFSYEIEGLEIIENPLSNPSIILKNTQIVSSEYDQFLKEWLNNRYEWNLIYRASEHGYYGESFHKYCDDQGPTLIVIKSYNGWIFGGYTTQSWKAMDLNKDGWKYKEDNNAFLFTLYNPYKMNPTRYNAFKNKGGIRCHPNEGPSFCDEDGSCDIIINLNGKNCIEKESCCINNDGTRGYEFDLQYRKSLFVNTAGFDHPNYFSVVEYEVFSCKELATCSIGI